MRLDIPDGQYLDSTQSTPKVNGLGYEHAGKLYRYSPAWYFNDLISSALLYIGESYGAPKEVIDACITIINHLRGKIT